MDPPKERLFSPRTLGTTSPQLNDSLAPARSALAGLRFRPMELPLLPSVSQY
jgi:hypothetical protein